MARIHVETLVRPEEQMAGTAAAQVTGAGPFWGPGFYPYQPYPPVVFAPQPFAITPVGPIPYGYSPTFIGPGPFIAPAVFPRVIVAPRRFRRYW